MMDVCDYQQVRELLERHGFHFSKAKGQNFLTQQWVPEQMVEEAGIDKGCGVLEIGPGIGSLTRELCRKAGRVTAVELDYTLKPILEETMAGFDNLELLFDNVMKADLPKLVQEHLGGLRPVACANLPYYITSLIVSLLLESRLFETVTVMVQKEVAQRICSRAGTADYSAFTVFCNYYAEPRILFDVPPDCFMPRPKVTSSVLQLVRREEPVCEIADEALFFKVVKASFAMRRKTLLNGLTAGFPQLGKTVLAEVLESCALPAAIRGETLDIPGFAAVTNEIYTRSRHV